MSVIASRRSAAASLVPGVAAGVALTIAALIAALLWLRAGPTWALALGDSDDYMRLVEVRDWLGGQSWWNVHQYRADPPGGVAVHWSRLADLPLAGAIVALRPLVGTAVAERVGLIAVPLLLLVATLLVQCRVAVAVAGRAAAVPAVAVGALSLMVVQFSPGRVDHHGLQILLVLVAMAGSTALPPRRGGAVAAVATAVSLTIGLEAAPLLAVIAGFVALDWAWRSDGRGAAAFGLVLAVAVPLLFALTVPLADWSAARSDAIGRGHVLAAIAGGAGLAALTAARLGRGGRVAGLALLGAALAVLVTAGFPEVFVAPYAHVGPILARVWAPNIVEMRSVAADARDSIWTAAAREFFPVAAAVAAVIEAARPAATRRAALLLAALTLAGTALSCWEWRGLPLACAVATPSAAVALARLWHRRAGSLIPFALTFVAFSHVPAAVLGRLGTAASGVRRVPGVACNTRQAQAALAAAARGVVLAPIDIGSTVLALTPQSVVAVGIHRDVHGNDFAYRVLLAPTATAQQLLAGSGVTYLGFCADAAETVVLTRAAPDGLLADLTRGRVPPWLVRFGAATSPFRTYRVVMPPG